MPDRSPAPLRRLTRMRERPRRVREAASLRAGISEICRRLQDGDLTVNGARAAMGLRPLGPVGDTYAMRRPRDLEGALLWQPAAPPFSDEDVERWQRAWDEVMADQPHWHRIVLLPQRAEFHPRPGRTVRRVKRMRKRAARAAGIASPAEILRARITAGVTTRDRITAAELSFLRPAFQVEAATPPSPWTDPNGA